MRTLLLLFFLLVLSSCYVMRAYRFRKFELKDLDKIDAVSLPRAAAPFRFASDTGSHPSLAAYLDSNLAASQTYAFLVIRHDTILYERYFSGVTDSTILPSFSMAKSVTSTLVGIALHEGKIKSLSEPITNYLPELARRDKRLSTVTIQHVLDMRSGVKSNESYTNPFSDVLKLGFARNVSRHALKVKRENAPGRFEYKSVNTQLLALIVERATGQKLQDYAAEKLWRPLQMEHAATWNVDKKNTARAFCCINAAAVDYAKFGRLFLKKGAWEGQQLVAPDWVSRSVSADTMLRYGGYKNQWWANAAYATFVDSLQAVAFVKSRAGKARMNMLIRPEGKRYRVEYYNGSFYAAGLLGQYVYVDPGKDVLIVRLGHNWSHPSMYAERFLAELSKRL